MAQYRATCESLARRYVGRNGAEFDDLVQEGLIDVWRCLERGITPAKANIENRLRTYCRWLGRQLPVSYEELLPLELDTPSERGQL